ncbi:mandelate racemase/muconate lactonizing enzyme family protein [Mycobacterium sp. WUMAC-067]|uniref:mandelate racemase/muconate lactonizing enzyme family protein n=1 Tax=unclassified Mycobacterium TaxID=2642494 RepID=UPI001CD9FA4E|nr:MULTISPECIES: mandelate racemase/muconate lactonizing enzyme family protein [unclassified Mycobacterium]MCA2242307.1 mandelate racemase/muconate lactonizing enzyme family protein [Mycobacterium sp. WUMAC-067]MCA2313658.1 mandelate racemase/muconate lactonizing enzyme family protein [Mycobacterium sp. WUMAC-025]
MAGITAPTAADRAAVIAKIETVPLRIPLKAGSTPGASLWGDALTAADSLLVKVTTSDGVEGWGEAFGFSAVDSAKLAVDQLITPLCIGRDATRIGPLMLEIQKKLHVFGRGGALTYGLSAVDIALWDIAGKLTHAPVSQLLGGGVTTMPCYASLACYSDPALVRAVVRQAIDAGFQVLKLHEAGVSAIRAAREEAGPDIELIVDAGCPWTLTEATAVADELRAARLKFLEEPLWPPEDFDGLAQLRRTTGIPISSGENASTVLEFERMLAAEAVDFVQPSPAKMGGISELRKVFPLAAVHNVPVMTHSFYDGPGLLAALHATAALGDIDSMIEWRWFELEASIYGDGLTPTAGRISVPQGPGLGIDPDPDVISAYRRQTTA